MAGLMIPKTCVNNIFFLNMYFNEDNQVVVFMCAGGFGVLAFGSATCVMYPLIGKGKPIIWYSGSTALSNSSQFM